MSEQMNSIEMTPVAFVEGGRVKPTKDQWAPVESVINLREDLFSTDALMGLEHQSHIEIVFYFHLQADEPIEFAARHPRNREDWPKVGIFAQRGRMRMNRIGVSICELLRIDGHKLHLRGLDAVDGTPVLDIKPVWSGYSPRGELREPEWAGEIMANYW